MGRSNVAPLIVAGALFARVGPSTTSLTSLTSAGTANHTYCGKKPTE
jgi:hypothetical protein